MSFEVSAGPRHLFAIHLLTASGAAFALLAIMAIADERWTEAFVWLGAALVVDGIDGPIARRFRVRERLPQWDGAALDFVIDYATYVFAPAIVIARALELPPLVGAACGMLVAVTGALYFADTRMKAPDNSFRGFPAVWNMAAFVLYALLPPPAITVAIIVLFAALTFMPVNFVHPLRVVRWRSVTVAVLGVWAVAGLWLIVTGFTAPLPVKLALLAATIYLNTVSAVQQFLRPA
jgi:phosphatidylcholine synthase